MCGLIAYSHIADGRLPKRLTRGLRSLGHRGPDAHGEKRDGGVFLGHRRLKILDLSDQANQPMASDDGRYTIVFNGEIYNYPELRGELLAKGWKLRTTGDTEVLLKLFIEMGEACLPRLNGMFAFVIHDAAERRFFAARDHFGIKPLYYVWDGKQLAFASEIRALLEAGIVPLEIDPAAVDQFLTWGSIQLPRTIVKGVTSLTPGHLLTFHEGAMQERPYWSLPNGAATDSGPEISEKDAVRRIRELLEDSVRGQLVSDVPLGAFLSGGVDSTTVVGLMRQLGVGEINTFSIGFGRGEDAFNETRYARQTAERFGTRHHEIVLGSDEVVDALHPFAKHLDQPSIDGINTFLISRFARERVTVCLSGLGGDEIFAGYHTVKWLHLFDRLDRFRPPLPAACGRATRWIYDRLPAPWQKNQLVRGGAFCGGAWPSDYDRYEMVRTLFTATERRRLTGYSNGAHAGDDYAFLRGLPSVDRAIYLDQAVYLRNTLLRDVDVMSMAHALEIRVPLLDWRLAELVASFPPAMKFRPGHYKRLLIKAAADLLPPDIGQRKKMGFTFPLHMWVNEPKMRAMMRDCLAPDSMVSRMVLDRRETEETIARNLKCLERTGSYHAFNKLWSMMVLELWLRKTVSAVQSRETPAQFDPREWHAAAVGA
jgi:asparagine synthase (glutamine-hydrolysing)